MTRNRNTKSCTICDKRIVITNSVQRKKWNGNNERDSKRKS